jgi:hypothetical protein
MSISTTKVPDQAIGYSKDAALGPSTTTTGTQSTNALTTTKNPVVGPINDPIFKDYLKHDWMYGFKSTAPATTSLQPASAPVVEKSDRVAISKAKPQLGEYEEVFARPTPSYTVRQVASRPSAKGAIKIEVCIGNLPKVLPSDESWFPAVLDVINRHTIQKPYACDASQMLDIGDAIIFRPIHNVTHAIRQVRLLRTLLDCLNIHGSNHSKKILETINPTERFLLQLGSFCLRVGRVDETNTHHPFPDSDGRKQRSAEIFSFYAAQLPDSIAPRDQISWVSSLISVACTPEELLPKAIIENDKSNLCVQLLASAHELDLYRCYNKPSMETPIEKVKTFLFIQTEDFEKAKVFQPRLEEYALKLMEATGSSIAYYNQSYRLAEFGANSLDAKYCWQTTGKVEKPVW